jgi:hypothetical protein
MRRHLGFILRMVAALVATLVSIYLLHSVRVDASFALGLDAHEHAILQAALDALVLLLAFAVGGAVAGRRFTIAATCLAILMQWSSLSVRADWHQTSLQAELAGRWPLALFFVASAVIGAIVGMALNRHFKPIARKGAT